MALVISEYPRTASPGVGEDSWGDSLTKLCCSDSSIMWCISQGFATTQRSLPIFQNDDFSCLLAVRSGELRECCVWG